MRETAAVEFPVMQSDGWALLGLLTAVSESDLDRLDPTIPLTASLTVVWNAGACPLVFNRFRSAWELPGGVIDAGEPLADLQPIDGALVGLCSAERSS